MKFKHLFSQALKSSIFKNLSVLMMGTLMAQLVVIGFQVVIRRLYSPEDFGAFAVYMSVLGITVTITSLRYEQTIVLPDKKENAVHLLRLALSINLIFSVVFFLLAILFKDGLASLLGLSENFAVWLLFLPLSVFLFGVYQAMNFYLIREKHFSLSASNKVFRRIFEGGIQSAFGTVGKTFGLIVGDIFGQLLMIIRFIAKCPELITAPFSQSELKKQALRYKDFPLKSAIPSILNSLSLLFPVLIINRFFDETVTGYFDLARMVLIIPLSLVTASLSQVLLQGFSEGRNAQRSVKKEALGTFAVLLVASILFVVIIEGFGVQLFSLVFGKEWASSGSYAQILVFAFAFKFVISPFNISFTAFERIGIGSIWQICYFILILSLLILPHPSIEIFLRNYLVVELIAYMLAAIMNFSILAGYEKSIKL